MAMQLNGNYDHSRTDYTERMKERQAAERMEKAEETGREAETKKLKNCRPPRMNT